MRQYAGLPCAWHGDLDAHGLCRHCSEPPVVLLHSPGDRLLERRVREWLIDCHKSLDRSVRFEGLVNQSAQVGAT